MVFESPAWLLGLVPWVLVALYLLPGNKQPQQVPFLGLWQSFSTSASGTSRRPPPLSTLVMLMSLLLALLAAGKPTLKSKRSANQHITIILDRGASMALGSISGRPFRGVIEKCRKQLGSLSSSSQVTLISLPGDKIDTTGDRWVAAANAMPRTVVATQVNQVVMNQLRETDGSIFVLTDQQIDTADKRVTQIIPEPPADSIAITAIGARTSLWPQVMVRVENHSSLRATKLRIKSGTISVEKEITLPARGNSLDVFIDLPAINKSVMAEIESEPSQNPWARAWLVSTSAGIKIITLGELPPPVTHMVNVYSTDRPPAKDSQAVFLSSNALDENQPGIWIDSGPSVSIASKTTTAQSHPLTDNIQAWPAAFGAHRRPLDLRL